jgi:beta-lactamase class A
MIIMKKLTILIFLLSLIINGFAQSIDRKLNMKLEELVKDFHGQVGIYVKNLKTGKTASLNADPLPAW